MELQVKFVVDKNDADAFSVLVSANKATRPGQPLKWAPDKPDTITGTTLVDYSPKQVTYTRELGSSVHLIVETKARIYTTIMPKTLVRHIPS